CKRTQGAFVSKHRTGGLRASIMSFEVTPPMKMIPALLMAVLLVLPAQAHTRASSGVDAHPVMQRGDEDPPLSVKAARITRPVVLDGVLDEPAWAEAPPISAFRQRDPVQGAEPTERTEVYI